MAQNGDLASSQLVLVQGPIQLAPQTADAYRRLAARARAQGENLDIWTPAGGYRSLAVQRDMIRRPSAYNVKPGVVLAAAGKSSHGQGRAVDLLGRRPWVKANAPAFGFRQRDAVNDPDCWVHGDYLETETAAPASGGVTPIGDDALTPEEHEWLRIAYQRIIDSVVPNIPNTINGLTQIRADLDYVNRTGPTSNAAILAAVKDLNVEAIAAAVVAKLPASSAGGFTVEQVKEAAQAGAAAALKNLSIPTAEQNGIAARNAIVK